MKKTQKQSDFGKGFIYNLVLFSKHWWKHTKYLEDEYFGEHNFEFWFDGAADHFYEFEIPEQFRKTKIGKLAKEIQDEAFARKDINTTKEEFNLFFDKLENLCMLIDKELGVDDIKSYNN